MGSVTGLDSCWGVVGVGSCVGSPGWEAMKPEKVLLPAQSQYKESRYLLYCCGLCRPGVNRELGPVWPKGHYCVVAWTAMSGGVN